MLKKILNDWKPGWKPMRFKATLVAIVAGAIITPLLFLALPFLDLFNDMAVQPKGKAQGHYGFFTDQQIQVERPPVPGTIPVGYVAYPYPKDDEKDTKWADEAGEKLKNPLLPTVANQRRGQVIFNRVCIACHGEHAEGDGPIVGPDLFPAPPSLHSKLARAFKDGHIFHVITRGQKKMPSYADTLEPAERWAVVHYVRTLQRAKEMSAK